MKLLSAETGTLDDGSPLPPVPIPTGPNDYPPNQSERIVLGTSTLRQGLWFDAEHSSDQGWVNETPLQPFPNSPYWLADWKDGSGPPQYTLTLRRYWQRGPYVTLNPGQFFSQEYELLYGISTTTAQTLSVELGVDVSGLSAKLSLAFEQSVTVETQSTEKKTFSMTAPAGEDLVWVLWQLHDEIVPLDGGGNVLYRYVGEGDYSLIPAPAPFAAGAWLYLSPTSTPVGVDVPHDAFKSKQTLFPTPVE